MLPHGATIEELRQRFRWQVPSQFNIAQACCDRWADGSGREALVEPGAAGGRRVWSFDQLAVLSRRCAAVMQARGIARGDRVGILLGQRVETAIAHLAAWRVGAVTVPLFSLFGPDALEYRLRHSGARLVVTDQERAARLEPLRERLPELLVVDGAAGDDEAFWPALDAAREIAETVLTAAGDPAVIIYTSGTTGAPKGALHAHRVLLGHLPGVQMPHEFFPQPGDRFWTPADWAWIGGLFDVLMPSLFFGVPVVVSPPGRFDPEVALHLMATEGVRNVFMPPTALRIMRQSGLDPLAAGVRLRTIGSGGERLGDDVLDWGRGRFGLTINEFYGQTEANLLISNMAALLPPRSGAMGVVVPGHEVAVLAPDGSPAAVDETGVIAVRRPDPVIFLGYWNNPDATADKFRGDWLLTGDLGRCDGDGFFYYLGREDDLINSAGYRIGPAEVESCLAHHPAVGLCAVIGVPDPVRGEIVKAFIVPRAGVVPDRELERDIRDFVRRRLAAHAYPRLLEFVGELPLTATGKIRRAELRARERARGEGPTPA